MHTEVCRGECLQLSPKGFRREREREKTNVAKCEQSMNQGEGYMGAHCAILALFLKFLKFSKQKVGGERDFPL